MIDEHRRFNLGLLNGGHIEIEVNFDKSEAVKESKVLRMFINGKTYDVLAKDLVSFLIMVGNIDTKKDLMPAKIKRVHKTQRMLHYKFNATQDYKKGDPIEVVAPFIDTHTDVEEMLGGAVKNAIKNKTLIIK